MNAARNKAATSAETGFYPIGTVSRLTGVSPITLRAWERRYGLIEPLRTESGHRLYCRNDIDLINQVVGLLDKGMRIGQVGDELAAEQARIESGKVTDSGPWDGFRRRMVNATIRFDEEALEEVYNEALSLYPIAIVTRMLLTPLLVELGERWRRRKGSVAEEHFFAFYLRNKLGARFHHRSRAYAGPKLLAACLPGEQHEIALLLFALTAGEAGYRLILLGADMPLDELAVAADKAGCQAIVLSGSVAPAPAVLEKQLAALVREARVPVLVGGEASVTCCDAVVERGAEALGSDLEQGLRQLQEILPVSRVD